MKTSKQIKGDINQNPKNNAKINEISEPAGTAAKCMPIKAPDTNSVSLNTIDHQRGGVADRKRAH